MAGWTGRIGDQEMRADADMILLEAATAGADLDGLRVIAQAAYEAWHAARPDQDPPGKGFEDRFARLDTTMDGAGRLAGDLTPECAAAVTAVLEALRKKRGPEDDRTAAQRFHDALQEGCELPRAVCRSAPGLSPIQHLGRWCLVSVPGRVHRASCASVPGRRA
jgi:Domain of unknown function (DUF222)